MSSASALRACVRLFFALLCFPFERQREAHRVRERDGRERARVCARKVAMKLGHITRQKEYTLLLCMHKHKSAARVHRTPSQHLLCTRARAQMNAAAASADVNQLSIHASGKARLFRIQKSRRVHDAVLLMRKRWKKYT